VKLRYESNRGKICRICDVSPARVKGRCEPCYRWWLRWGTERSEAAILRHGRRLENDKHVI
jgi:hypothetical protein